MLKQRGEEAIQMTMAPQARHDGGPLRIRGTAVYLSPEGFEGHLTEKSDLWALGVMIFEMILGRRPFQAPLPSPLRVAFVRRTTWLCCGSRWRSRRWRSMSSRACWWRWCKACCTRTRSPGSRRRTSVLDRFGGVSKECRSLAWFDQPPLASTEGSQRPGATGAPKKAAEAREDRLSGQRELLSPDRWGPKSIPRVLRCLKSLLFHGFFMCFIVKTL